MVTSTRAYGANTSTSFPTMGDKWMKHCMNLVPGPSRYTTDVRRKNTASASGPAKTASHRGRTMIHEANGPKFHVVAKLYGSNAAAASQQQRNVRTLPPVIRRTDGTGSAGDFWSSRKTNGAGQRS